MKANLGYKSSLTIFVVFSVCFISSNFQISKFSAVFL